MDELQIRSNLKKLVAGFLVIFLVIGAVSQYLFVSVTDLYAESVHRQLEERALQYEKSFDFKMNADLQTLRAMARMLEDAYEENDTSTSLARFLENLWDAGKSIGFVRLCYFSADGEGMQMSSRGQVTNIKIGTEAQEMQEAIQRAMVGEDYCSQAFYDPVLRYTTLGYTTPVYIQGEVIGVLACAVSTRDYAEILSSVGSVSDIGAAAVLSNDGKVLASTRNHPNQEFYDLEGSNQLDSETKTSFMEALAMDETQFFEFNFDDLTLYACVMPMDVYSDNIVIVDTDKGISEAVSGVVDYAYVFGILFGATALLFGVSVLYINRRYNRQLYQVAYHDRLTGAYNRYKFFQLLDQNWKKNTECTVVAVNIRKFKYINELFTPARSDQLLKDICTVLKKHMQPGEFFCRDTADTFVLSLSTLEQDQVRDRLERMFAEVKESSKSIRPNYPISFYCGCASTLDCSCKSRNEELMSHVMLALSRAKQTQQAHISFYDAEIHEKENLQNYIENNMESALENGQFQMFLQPQVDLKQETIAGAEALVRWVVDGQKMIYPDQFIPIFERNGFCVQLDYYMIEQACKQIRAWMDAGLTPVPVSVNQTKLLLYEDDYVQRICEVTQRYGISGKYIVLEILEGLALENPKQVAERIQLLHGYGFRISMDDFGTGYASLTTLSQMQIDELKLDRSFLAPSDESTENNRRKILESVIGVAKRLNISTVAEGIETEEHRKLMQEIGCDYGQGYYYSRPIPTAEFTKKFLTPDSPSAEDPETKGIVSPQ